MEGDLSRDAEDSLRFLWQRIVDSDLGALLQLDTPVVPLSLAHRGDILEASVELDLVTLSRGLHATVAAEVPELLGTGAGRN
jgi:hypothetical protein